ncbi:MAG: hypothetical protein EBR82_81450, partial [Caulobacteraceae bacterium]|nr:hypothetical protein [Caulobacteraceae bacterium]
MPAADPVPEITDRQREVLGFIARFYADHGYAVTNRQICKQFNFASPNAAVMHLKALASTLTKTRARCSSSPPTRSVPSCGDASPSPTRSRPRRRRSRSRRSRSPRAWSG